MEYGRPLYFCPAVSFFLLLLLSSFLPRLTQPSQTGCLPYFHTWCGLSANLECRSELRNVLQSARWKCRTEKNRTNLLGYIFATNARIDNRKNLLSRNISSTCPRNMVNFSLLAAEIVSLVWSTPANFNGFRDLASLLQRRRSMEANQNLHNVWPLPAWASKLYDVSQKTSHV